MARNLKSPNIPLLKPQLHPAVFQVGLPPQPEDRSVDSVTFQRSIPIDVSEKRNSFRLYSQQTGQNNFAHEMLRGVWEPNAIAIQYFSAKNLDLLQNNLRHMVWKRTGHLIDEQDENVIKVTMKTMYMQYGLNPKLPREPRKAQQIIDAEIKRLNVMVLQDIVPQTISGVEQYLGYLRDASQNPVPIEQPKNLSVTGTRSLREPSSIIFAEPLDMDDVLSSETR